MYSLGCILWEMLVGAPPFGGNSLQEILTLHVSRPAPLTQLSRFHPSLQAVVARLLVKEPDGRFANAGAVVKALERCRERIEHGETMAQEAPPSHLMTAESGAARAGATNGRPTSAAAFLGRRGLLIGAVSFLALGAVVFGVFSKFDRGRLASSSNPPTATTPIPLNSSDVPPAGAGALQISAAPVRETPPLKSIAVLPFENRSSDKENAYFADGVQDEILTDLAKIAELKVISRTSVMQFGPGTKRNLPDIARALGVTYVLEGSVQRAGGKVRVTVQLIDARTDGSVWAERYDRELADVFAIQSEIANTIADRLQAKISPRRKGRYRATADHEFGRLRFVHAREVAH